MRLGLSDSYQGHSLAILRILWHLQSSHMSKDLPVGYTRVSGTCRAT